MGSFKDKFTKEQKAAIIGALVVQALSSGQMRPKKAKFYVFIASMLDIELDDPIHDKVASGGNNKIVRILNTLDRNLKEWFIITLHELVMADGVPRDIEIRSALLFAKDIGITEPEYKRIVLKANNIMRKHNL
ncbi:MAG: hypothetical protein RBQ97_09450 [Acholeplasma sp.]|nr:hypothetical protein [Acholeplasma sp.]